MENKETLEEAAFNFTAGKSVKEICSRMDFIKGSKFGAKWQQEQNKKLYSEEDLHNAFYNGWIYRGDNYTFPKAKKEWIEKFYKI